MIAAALQAALRSPPWNTSDPKQEPPGLEEQDNRGFATGFCELASGIATVVIKARVRTERPI